MSLPKLPETSRTTTAPRASAATAPLAEAMAPPQGMQQRALLPLRAWDTPGQKVMAYFLGIRPSSKFEGRSLVDLVNDDGVVESYACPVILEQLLRGVLPYTVVCIHYRGEEPGAKGETKIFEVFVGDTVKK